MLIRKLGLYFKYIITKIRLRNKVSFNGFTIVYTFDGSSIDFKDGEAKTVINSSSIIKENAL